uniref:Xylosyltransferase 1 n=1 Tax=Aegilops tauschii subsp. strangulata TaxID=200361 RepID=A0A453DQQ2_AEGTS
MPLVSVSFVSLMLFLSALSGYSASSALFARLPPPSYVRRGAAAPPSFAYLLSGGRGDGRRLLRLLLAVYHPRNQYLLHLSADAPEAERLDLAAAVARAAPAITAFGNVDVVGRPAAGTPMGSSGLAATLRAAAALLRLDAEWDWFVTLSAADYPLLTQDDLIHVFSSVPRHLNFIDHTSDIGWKESQRVQPVIVDAGIYLAGRNQFFQSTEKRATPDGFKFFTGIIIIPLLLLPFSLGHSKPAVYRVLHFRMGEPPSNPSHVLHQRDAASGRLFPLGRVQLGLP